MRELIRAVSAIVAVLAGLALAWPTAADDAPKYSFATAQVSKEITAPPGGEGRGIIYFYNIDGNRLTHVTLSVSQKPAAWDVVIEPPKREVEVSVNGQAVKVTENLHVEPSQLLAQETKDVPEGSVCVPVPGRGYTLGKVASIVVRVPASEKLGTTGEVKVSAEAAWLGQTGAATIRQARDFDFTVEVGVAPEGFSETIIGEAGQSATGRASASAAGQGEVYQSFLDRWLPTILAAIIIVLGALLIPSLVRRSARRQ